MNLNFDRNAKIKIFLILLLILVAPYFAPFAIEFVILADFMGLEALLVFLFAYSKPILAAIHVRLSELKGSIAATAQLVVALPLFMPRIYISHATASSIFAVFACSIFLACVVWLPVMMLSTRYIS